MNSEFTSFDGESFPFRSWNADPTTHTVIVAIHGISGAAQDYTRFAEYLATHSPGMALYCQETRGQGLDPLPQRRGDIHRPEEWYHDFFAFTHFIKSRHPHARLIGCGESMGSLIITHALVQASAPIADFSGLILLAPVVKIGDQVPRWKIQLAKALAALLPKWRIRLEALSGSPDVKVTQGETSHTTQAATNPWQVESYTLRLLATLGRHIQAMPTIASQLHLPTLILSGGNDFFTPAEFTREYVAAFPNQKSTTHHHFPDAYHLLMYDDQREEIFATAVDFLRNLLKTAH